ncbi:hypothetical protein KDX05_06995 [Burkholderia vietnamiensis]|uniref:hypothetical protein n=1 Tax=Burkholderia vietnamiensis TaxID=60552 RepID=UPI001B90A770|nr:hypothetical protein [Burkholderia vietnamiensis]MBR8228057.1 hypothetical protein [Burkholderia vietnamiensis]
MRFAYADPPYLGLAEKFYGHLHPEAAAYDHIDAHKALVARLCDEFSDGWAMSMTSGNLHDILPIVPKEARIMAWVKPFASFKPGVGVAYAWEPVVVMGGRRRTREQRTVRDWCAVNITLKRGFTGAKPADFVFWILDVLNVQPVDEICDLFPGSGAVQQAIDSFLNAQSGHIQDGLFA